MNHTHSVMYTHFSQTGTPLGPPNMHVLISPWFKEGCLVHGCMLVVSAQIVSSFPKKSSYFGALLCKEN